jgi:DNA polymerase III subunit beta
MYFEINSKDLIPATKSLASVAQTKGTIPVLAHVLIAIKDNGDDTGKVVLTATDSEITIQHTLELQDFDINEVNATTISAKKFSEIVRSTNGLLKFQLAKDGEGATIAVNRSRFSLQTLPPTDFPEPENVTKGLELRIPKGLFKSLFSTTAFAAAKDDIRYYLNGLCLDIANDSLTVIGTDGHRLALATINTDELDEPILQATLSDNKQVIIPTKAVAEILRNIDASNDLITIIIDDNKIKVVFSESLTLVSKLIEGRYPDYKLVLPKLGNIVMEVNVEDLKKTLAQVKILSNERFHGVALDIKDDKLTVSSKNTEREEAEVDLPITLTVSENAEWENEFKIGFNVNYLQDALAVIATENAVFHLSEPQNSTAIIPEGTNAVKFVISAMRL